MKQYSTIYCNIIQYNAIEYNMIRYVAISSCNKIRDLLCIMENNSNIDKLYIYIENISPCPQDPDAKEGDLDRWARGLRDLTGWYMG